MKKIINLTPHKVCICDHVGNVVHTYWPEGMVARINHAWETVDDIDGIPVVERVNEQIINLPEPQEDTLYIVSNVVLELAWGREDLIAPVQQVKVNGQVIGCRAFTRG